MKKFLLVLFLFVSSFLKAQTYLADSLAYYSNIWNNKPDTVLGEPITIKIENKVILITKSNARFKAQIIDTVEKVMTGPYSYRETYTIRVKPTAYESDTTYDMELLMSFYHGELIVLALSKGDQLFIYHIAARLFSTYIKPKEWTEIKK